MIRPLQISSSSETESLAVAHLAGRGGLTLNKGQETIQICVASRRRCIVRNAAFDEFVVVRTSECTNTNLDSTV